MFGILKSIHTGKDEWYVTSPVTSDHTSTGETALFPKSLQKAAMQSRKKSSVELTLWKTRITKHIAASY